MVSSNPIRFKLLLLLLYCESNGYQLISSRYQSSPYRVTVTEENDFYEKRTFMDVDPNDVEPNLVRREEVELQLHPETKGASDVHAMVIAKFDADEMNMPELLQQPFDPNEDRIPVLMATTDRSKPRTSYKKNTKNQHLPWEAPLDLNDKSEYQQKYFRSAAPYYGFSSLNSYTRHFYPPPPSYPPPPPTPSYSPPQESRVHSPQASRLYPPTSYMTHGYHENFGQRINDSAMTPNASASHPVPAFLPASVSASSFISKLRALDDNSRVPLFIITPKRQPMINPRILSEDAERPAKQYPRSQATPKYSKAIGTQASDTSYKTYSSANSGGRSNSSPQHNSRQMPMLWQRHPGAIYKEATIPLLSISPRGTRSRSAMPFAAASFSRNNIP